MIAQSLRKMQFYSMKSNSPIKQIVTGIILIGLITGCQSPAEKAGNEEKKETVATTKATGDNLITFKVNGEQVSTTGWTISRFAWNTDAAHPWLNITSNMKTEKRTINVNLNGAVPGTYFLVEGGALKQQSHGSFFPNYIEDMGNNFSFSDGTFTITDIDTIHHRVNAEFRGVVKNIKGETLQITDGHIINGLLNTNVITY